METNTIVRLVCTLVAVVLLGAIILRRKSRNAEE
jgi:hypothetical protein